MFNGLIKDIGMINSFNKNSLIVESSYKPKIGDSIAINGVCLTATKLYNNSFEVDLSEETQKIIPLENYKSGNLVHIEPALRFGDRVDGHLIQGHVDAIGTILEIKQNTNSYDLIIQTNKEIMKYIIHKGSIAIDGVSLTVNEVFSDRFRLTIIPHTFKNTIFKYYKVKRRVNIETDMFARYLYHMFKSRKDNNIDDILAWW